MSEWFDAYRGTPFLIEALKIEQAELAFRAEQKKLRAAREAREAEVRKIYAKIEAARTAANKETAGLYAEIEKIRKPDESVWQADDKFYAKTSAQRDALRQKYITWLESEAGKMPVAKSLTGESMDIFTALRAFNADELLKSDEPEEELERGLDMTNDAHHGGDEIVGAPADPVAKSLKQSPEYASALLQHTADARQRQPVFIPAPAAPARRASTAVRIS